MLFLYQEGFLMLKKSSIAVRGTVAESLVKIGDSTV